MTSRCEEACRDYRDLFVQRREEVWTGAREIPSAAAVTWMLCLERAESLLPGPFVRLMPVFVALLDGHGIPGAVFGTQAMIAYLGGAVTPFSAADRAWRTSAKTDGRDEFRVPMSKGPDFT